MFMKRRTAGGPVGRASAQGRIPAHGLAVVIVLACAVLGGLASVAGAATGHRYSGQFGSYGTGAGDLYGPAGIAIEASSQELYVADQYNSRIERFDAAGDFLSVLDGHDTPAGAFAYPSAVAVDQSTGAVYVADLGNNVVDKFDASGAYVSQINGSGTPAASFTYPGGLAVDPVNGDLYVSDSGANVVDRFDSSGAYLDQLGEPGSGDGQLLSPGQLAVDGSHGVYVTDSGNGRVQEFTGGAYSRTVDAHTSSSVAVDPATGHVYVGNSSAAGPQVAEYAADGTLVHEFGAGRLQSAAAIVVNPASGKVYVADQAANTVQMFTAVTLPTVSTGNATGIGPTGATLEGTVNPEGVAGSTTYRFEYGLDTSYGTTTGETDTGGGAVGVPASVPVTGLAPNTTYHFRVVGTNPSGSISGADRTFTTDPAPPTIDPAAPSPRRSCRRARCSTQR